MRVKIQHSVNIADVEDKVIDLISESETHIGKIDSKAKDLMSVVNMEVSNLKYKLAMELIHSIREQLALYDSVLGDVNSIIDGLDRYHETADTQPASQPAAQEQPTPVPTPEEMQTVVDNISERFANIKQELANVDKG